jgi:hypothetical protein
MAQAKKGDLVQVDISGIEMPGISIGGGVVAPGEIIEIYPERGELKVRLGFSLDDMDLVTVSASRVKLVPDAQVGVVHAALAHAR